MSTEREMLRLPSIRNVRGEIVTPSMDSRMNHPQKMFISNRPATEAQSSRLMLMLPNSAEIWPSKSALSVGSASSIQPPVFLITTAPDDNKNSYPLTHPAV